MGLGWCTHCPLGVKGHALWVLEGSPGPWRAKAETTFQFIGRSHILESWPKWTAILRRSLDLCYKSTVSSSVRPRNTLRCPTPQCVFPRRGVRFREEGLCEGWVCLTFHCFPNADGGMAVTDAAALNGCYWHFRGDGIISMSTLRGKEIEKTKSRNRKYLEVYFS